MSEKMTTDEVKTGGGESDRGKRKLRSDKGTLGKLLTAARSVFGRRGWHDTTVDDIITQAGVSHGTFYVYFENKHDIFERLTTPLLEELFCRADSKRAGSTIFERLEAGNRAYFDVWNESTDLMWLITEVGSDPVLGAGLREMRRRFEARSARALRRHVVEGLTHPGLDPDAAASAVAGMVTDHAEQIFWPSSSPTKLSPQELLNHSFQLTALWYRAVYSPIAPPVPEQTSYCRSVLGDLEANGLNTQ